MDFSYPKDLRDLTLYLFNRVKESDFEYVYRGVFDHDMTKKILSLADANIQKTLDKATIQKRIYHIMVEGLQNVTRHQDKTERIESSSIFSIQKKNCLYFVTTGNIIFNENVDSLKGKIEKINSLEKDALSKYHKEVLMSGSITDKGGAGLGLIEMARKSGKKLHYDFKFLDDVYSYFYLQTEIPTETIEGEHIVEWEKKALSNIKELHECMNENRILINFNGFFDQPNVLNLLSVLRGQHFTGMAKKINHLMVEMLQNISKHADKRGYTFEGNPGIFYLIEHNNQFELTAGNYIHKNQISALEAKLKQINQFSAEELSKFYDETLQSEISHHKYTGLGLADIRMRSNHPIEYFFYDLEGEYSFFVLQIVVTVK